MQEISKNKVTRYRCDHCEKLIPVKDEKKMAEMDGTPFSAFDDRWYHFCNKSHWEKTFNRAYQLRQEFLADADVDQLPSSNTGVKHHKLVGQI